MSVPRGTPADGQLKELSPLYYCPFCNPYGFPGGATIQVATTVGDDGKERDLEHPVFLHSMPPCARFGRDESFDATWGAMKEIGLREVPLPS